MFKFCKNLESVDAGWSDSLKLVSLELLAAKNKFRFSFGKMLVSLEKKEIIKTRIYYENTRMWLFRKWSVRLAAWTDIQKKLFFLCHGIAHC